MAEGLRGALPTHHRGRCNPGGRPQGRLPRLTRWLASNRRGCPLKRASTGETKIPGDSRRDERRRALGMEYTLTARGEGRGSVRVTATGARGEHATSRLGLEVVLPRTSKGAARARGRRWRKRPWDGRFCFVESCPR